MFLSRESFADMLAMTQAQYKGCTVEEESDNNLEP